MPNIFLWFAPSGSHLVVLLSFDLIGGGQYFSFSTCTYVKKRCIFALINKRYGFSCPPDGALYDECIKFTSNNILAGELSQFIQDKV